MITAREAGIGLFGAWQLAKFNAHGQQFFDNSVTMFWRSFSAAVIALPAYVITSLLPLGMKETTVGPLGVLIIEGIAYVIAWTLFPLVMFHVTKLIDRGRWYCRYIAAYNWATVLQVSLFLVVSLAVASGLLPSALAELLKFLAFVAVLAYQWFIARVMLEASGPAAMGIVLLDLVISVVLEGYKWLLLQGHGLLG